MWIAIGDTSKSCPGSMQDDCEGMSDDVFSEQTQISEVPAVNGD
jgi:hypothetical protein